MATNEQNLEQTVDAGVTQTEMDVGGDNGHREHHCSCPSLTTLSARYVYAGIFFLANIVAWVERENPITYFMGQRLSGCEGHRDCLAAEGVLIISLAFFLFFSIMFFSTVGTRTVQDRRNSWHFQWWWLKALLLLGCLVISVFIPSDGIQLYGKAAHFGAGVFLLVQLISVIRFITRLNYKWCQINIENHYLEVITTSVLAYSASIVGIILMFFWYKGCLVNITFIVTTLVLVCLMALISLLSKSKGFYMEPGLMGAYIVLLCWSAIKSEPDTSCFKKGKAGSGDNWITIISFIVELISITVATFSTGTDDYRCINFRNVVETVNDVPYGYGFFHFVFAMGSMYFGMLFVGWDTHHTSEKWSMDVGWTSTWVHIGNEHLAVISFVAVVIARIYGIGWLQQLLGKIFGIGGEQQENNNDAHHTEPEGYAVDNVPPQGSRATDPEGSATDNRPPQESHGTDLERSEMDDNGPPPSSSLMLAELLHTPLSPWSDSDEIVEVK
ncbi:uncharacterized protein [Miscanthus floridulus]|uniref:uncharacterized protein isoform X2 n=1 Tax=Miscanthus floridulus TaxID=154761 RepID=UPI0034592A03